jgi:hypothetical protein
MVIDNCDLSESVGISDEQDSELIVDADGVESRQIPFLPLKPISWWNLEILKTPGPRHLIELSPCDSMQFGRKGLQGRLGLSPLEDVATGVVGKLQLHYMTALPLHVKKLSEYLRPCLVASSGFVSLLVSIGCVSRAPTKCELDKRSGLYPTSYCDGEQVQGTSAPQALSASVGSTHATGLPVREGPVVAKVWVADQVLDGGHWMQGTWLFVEVESSRWSGEVRRVKVAASTLGAKKSDAKANVPAFNPALNPVAPSEGTSSARSVRGGDK